jgi:hypothetical protein
MVHKRYSPTNQASTQPTEASGIGAGAVPEPAGEESSVGAPAGWRHRLDRGSARARRGRRLKEQGWRSAEGTGRA